MKRTPIDKIPYPVPESISGIIEGARLYDSSCSPEARVYFIDNGCGYYLKASAEGSLKNEALMTEYYHRIGLGAGVVQYGSLDGRDFLLTERVNGEDCTHSLYLESPKRLTDTIAELLRQLHDTDCIGCPIENRMDSYFRLADENFRRGQYDLSYYEGFFGKITPDDAYRLATDHKSALNSRVLLHGDYCLPNIMLDDWRLSGFIDVGNGGVGDRHIDVFWGAWTLGFNLKTQKYRERFFDAYGKDKIDMEKIKIIAAAECFG